MKDIDTLIATKIMGWKKRRAFFHLYSPEYWFDGDERQTAVSSWKPSTNIAKALIVVKKMILDGYSFEVNHYGSFIADFGLPPKYEIGGQAEEKTAPLAICKAALSAVEIT